MPDSASKKTWRDVVAAMPSGTIRVIRDSVQEGGVIVGIRIDERGGFMLVEHEQAFTKTSWLKPEPGIMSVTEIPFSVEFSEEETGTKDWRFTAHHGGVVVTMYVRKRLPIT